MVCRRCGGSVEHDVDGFCRTCAEAGPGDDVVIDLSDEAIARWSDPDRYAPADRPVRIPSIRDLKRTEPGSYPSGPPGASLPPLMPLADPTPPPPPTPASGGTPPAPTAPLPAPAPAAGREPKISIVHSVLDTDEKLGIDVLHDRVVLGCAKPIDRLVIAPSGVWVVDAFDFVGKVEPPPPSTRPWRRRAALVVGGRERTDLVVDVRCRVSAVRSLLVDIAPQVPVHGCLCFRAQDMGRGVAPFTYDDVVLASRRDLAAALGARPVVDPPTRSLILSALDARLFTRP